MEEKTGKAGCVLFTLLVIHVKTEALGWDGGAALSVKEWDLISRAVPRTLRSL